MRLFVSYDFKVTVIYKKTEEKIHPRLTKVWKSQQYKYDHIISSYSFYKQFDLSSERM